MIEARLLPVVLAVAVGARGAELAPVLVVLLVATVAFRRRLPEFLRRGVAGAALDLGGRVGSPEDEIGLPMVEAARLERGDVGPAPLVIGVAAAALLLREPAVVAASLRDLARDLLVAVEAQAGLRRPIEPDVAVLAFALELGMAALSTCARKPHGRSR